jgi:hypothetical protein
METRPYVDNDCDVPPRLTDLPVTAVTDENKWKAVKGFKRKVADALASKRIPAETIRPISVAIPPNISKPICPAPATFPKITRKPAPLGSTEAKLSHESTLYSMSGCGGGGPSHNSHSLGIVSEEGKRFEVFGVLELGYCFFHSLNFLLSHRGLDIFNT